MKKILTFWLSIVLTTNLLYTNNTYSLTGKLPDNNLNGTLVYLNAVKNHLEEFNRIDSTVIDNGSFLFKSININDTDIHRIDFEGNIMQPFFFFPEKGNIEVAFNKEDMPEITGTILNKEYQNYIDQIYNLNKKLTESKQKTQATKEQKKLTANIFSALQKEQNALEQELENTIITYIEKNVHNALGKYIFIENSDYLSPKKILTILPLFNSDFRTEKQVKKIEENAISSSNTQEGRFFSNIEAFDTENNTVRLSQYLGREKHVLVWIWASWCAPCRNMTPEIRELHRKYKNKLTIFSVSLDQDRTLWMKAIKNEKLPDVQLILEKDWSDPMLNTYGITYIPQYILIDKNGTIIGKGLSSDELNFKLEKLLK